MGRGVTAGRDHSSWRDPPITVCLDSIRNALRVVLNWLLTCKYLVCGNLISRVKAQSGAYNMPISPDRHPVLNPSKRVGPDSVRYALQVVLDWLSTRVECSINCQASISVLGSGACWIGYRSTLAYWSVLPVPGYACHDIPGGVHCDPVGVRTCSSRTHRRKIADREPVHVDVRPHRCRILISGNGIAVNGVGGDQPGSNPMCRSLSQHDRRRMPGGSGFQFRYLKPIVEIGIALDNRLEIPVETRHRDMSSVFRPATHTFSR